MLGPAAWSLRSHGVGKVIVQPSREMTRRGRRAGTGTVCEAQSAERHSAKKLAIKFREAITSGEHRAAAAVRAASFYTYPTDRSELAIRAHVRMKVDLEWNAIEAKASGQDPAYKDMGFACLLATVPFDPDSADDDALAAGLDASCRVVTPDGMELVVGTLDLNRGWKLPAEELSGMEPKNAEGASQRIYLSNVCVAPMARRRGVAHGLLEYAVTECIRKKASRIYVHVVHDNTAAARAYEAVGFQVEAAETPKDAQSRGRPRRLLLTMPTPQPGWRAPLRGGGGVGHQQEAPAAAAHAAAGGGSMM